VSGRKRRKTVEIVLRVSVPADWSVRHARHEVTQAWYGEIYARGPGLLDAEAVLRPRWGRARLAD